jgi:hypothetical protein
MPTLKVNSWLRWGNSSSTAGGRCGRGPTRARGGVPRGGDASSKTSARATCGQGRRSGLGVCGRLVGMGDPDVEGGLDATPWSAQARSEAWKRGAARHSRFKFCLHMFDRRFPKIFKQNFKNFECESCRATIWEQLLERLAYVLINGLSTNSSQRCCLSRLRWRVLNRSWPSFSPFSTPNWNVTQKQSCDPRKTRQLLCWENLKCLGEICRTRQKF